MRTRFLALSFSSPASTDDTADKILLLGGSGFVGSEIARQARARSGVKCIALSSADFDLTAPNAQERVAQAAQGCVVVISTVGSMTGTEQDLSVNAATAAATKGAKQAGVPRFVAIGNSQRVRRLSHSVPFLQNCAAGKEESEKVIRELFGFQGCIVQPTFIYGGDEFGLSPPRVASSVGKVVEELETLSTPSLVSGIARYCWGHSRTTDIGRKCGGRLSQCSLRIL